MTGTADVPPEHLWTVPDAAGADWFLAMPRKRVAAGLLVVDDSGRVLLVKPTYKPPWEIPGGLVEGGEAPRAAAAREAREELGHDVAVGRLLVVDHAPPGRLPDDVLAFVYAGGPVVSARIVLPPEELSAWEWVAPDRLDGRVGAAMARRLRAALAALTSGATVELESGRPAG